MDRNNGGDPLAPPRPPKSQPRVHRPRAPEPPNMNHSSSSSSGNIHLPQTQPPPLLPPPLLSPQQLLQQELRPRPPSLSSSTAATLSNLQTNNNNNDININNNNLINNDNSNAQHLQILSLPPRGLIIAAGGSGVGEGGIGVSSSSATAPKIPLRPSVLHSSSQLSPLLSQNQRHHNHSQPQLQQHPTTLSSTISTNNQRPAPTHKIVGSSTSPLPAPTTAPLIPLQQSSITLVGRRPQQAEAAASSSHLNHSHPQHSLGVFPGSPLFIRTSHNNSSANSNLNNSNNNNIINNSLSLTTTGGIGAGLGQSSPIISTLTRNLTNLSNNIISNLNISTANSPASGEPPSSVTLAAPRPENERLTNEYVDTPFIHRTIAGSPITSHNNNNNSNSSNNNIHGAHTTTSALVVSATSSVNAAAAPPLFNVTSAAAVVQQHHSTPRLAPNGGNHSPSPSSMTAGPTTRLLGHHSESSGRCPGSPQSQAAKLLQHCHGGGLTLNDGVISPAVITKQPTGTLKKDLDMIHSIDKLDGAELSTNLIDSGVLGTDTIGHSRSAALLLHDSIELAASATAVGQGSSITCPQCEKCRCENCQKLRPLPSKWLCGKTCFCSAESVLDYMSCLCCVKALFYHCSKDHEIDNENGNSISCADDPCSCLPHKRTARWSCLGALSLLLPCLACYWPMRGVISLCAKCYAKHTRQGCQCNAGKSGSSGGNGLGGGGGRGQHLSFHQRQLQQQQQQHHHQMQHFSGNSNHGGYGGKKVFPVDEGKMMIMIEQQKTCNKKLNSSSGCHQINKNSNNSIGNKIIDCDNKNGSIMARAADDQQQQLELVTSRRQCGNENSNRSLLSPTLPHECCGNFNENLILNEDDECHDEEDRIMNASRSAKTIITTTTAANTTASCPINSSDNNFNSSETHCSSLMRTLRIKSPTSTTSSTSSQLSLLRPSLTTEEYHHHHHPQHQQQEATSTLSASSAQSRNLLELIN